MININKKIVFVAIFLLIVLGILIYLVINRQKSNVVTEVTKQPEPVSPVFSRIETVSIGDIALDEKVFFPKFYNNSIYYLGNKGVTFYQYDLKNQKKTKLYDNELLGIRQVKFSPNFQRAYFYSDYPEINQFIIDLKNRIKYDLPKDLKYLEWFGNEKIVYIFEKENSYELTAANFDGKNWKKIKEFPGKHQEVFVASILDKNILYFLQPNDVRGATFYSISLSGEEKSISAANKAANPLISPDGKLIVYDYFEKDISETAIKILGELENKLILKNKISVSQTIWTPDSKKLISFYYNKETQEKYFVISDAENGEQEKININYSGLQPFADLSDLNYSPEDKNLYFTSKDWLHKINLKNYLD